MNKEEMTDLIIASKKSKGLTWEAIAAKLDMGVTWVTSACFGMNSTSEEVAKRLCEILDLGDDVAEALQEFLHKAWDKTIPQDPVVLSAVRNCRCIWRYDQRNHW